MILETLETEGALSLDEARSVRDWATEIAHRASALADAWEQDQRKQKWREHVRWCHDELCATITQAQEAFDNG